MARSTEEWRGATDDAMPPPRARIRIFEKSGGRCAGCTRKVGPGFEPMEFDHVIPLIAGGANSEGNFQILCRTCHRAKTTGEVSEKSKIATIRKKHLGLSKPKKPWSKFRKKMDGSVILREDKP